MCVCPLRRLASFWNGESARCVPFIACHALTADTLTAVSCSDVATKELILSLNAAKPEKEKFLIFDLDEGHLFVKSEVVAWIQEQLKEYQKKITYEAPRKEK